MNIGGWGEWQERSQITMVIKKEIDETVSTWKRMALTSWSAKLPWFWDLVPCKFKRRAYSIACDQRIKFATTMFNFESSHQ